MAENTADKTRRLVEKFLETGNDAFLDEANECDHDYIHLLPGHRSILKEYMEHRLELHAHFVWVDNGVRGANKDFCATGRFVCDSCCCKDKSGLINKLNLGVFAPYACQGERPVLIDVVKLTENPQGMVLRESCELRTSIRLQPLDNCLRSNGHTAEPIFTKVQIERGMMKADRELISRSRPSLVNENQFSNDVIECRSEIVETFADDNAEPWQRLGNVSAKAEKPMVVSISFGDNFTLVQTPLSILPYRVKVFFSPDDFMPDTVEGMHK